MKWAARGGLVLFLGTEIGVAPRITLGGFARMIESDAGRVEIGVDLAPGFDDFGRTNLYLAATGAYVGFVGDGTLYWKAGGGALLETQDGTSYFIGIIEGGPAMLGEYGTPKPEIWRNDKLPMNDAGYAIWIPITKKALSTSR